MSAAEAGDVRVGAELRQELGLLLVAAAKKNRHRDEIRRGQRQSAGQISPRQLFGREHSRDRGALAESAVLLRDARRQKTELPTARQDCGGEIALLVRIARVLAQFLRRELARGFDEHLLLF